MATRADWAESLAPGLHAWIDDAYKQLPPLYTQVAHVETSSQAYEEDIDSTGVGYLEQATEQNPPKYEDPLSGYKTRYTHVLFRKGIRVTKEEYDDDLYRIFKRRGDKLGKAGRRTLDYQFFSLFRNAFSTSYMSYGDAKPLASTSHTRRDGGTAQSNASATGIKLTEENFETGALALREVLDNKGQVIEVGDSKLTCIVPLKLEKVAKIIFNSTLRSGTAENDYNTYDGYVNLIATRWISALAGGSDTAWFILDQMNHMLNFFMREAFNVDDVYDAELRLLKMIANTRFSFGWSDWRGVWGSKGNLTAYSS